MRFKNHYSLTISKLDEIGSSVQMSTDVENQVPSLVDVQGHMNESYNLIKAVGEYFIQRNRTRELQKRVNTGKEVLDNYLVEEEKRYDYLLSSAEKQFIFFVKNQKKRLDIVRQKQSLVNLNKANQAKADRSQEEQINNNVRRILEIYKDYLDGLDKEIQRLNNDEHAVINCTQVQKLEDDFQKNYRLVQKYLTNWR